MSKEKNQQPDGSEQDLSEFTKDRKPEPSDSGGGGSFMRGCGVVVGIVALIFFFIVGACFINLSKW